ncbi:MAG: hypothetical protein U1F43_24215 [Myxococcota bacterium]
MRPRIAMFLAVFAVAVAFVATAPARAGIIVTVGKPSPEDAKKTKTGSLPGYTGDTRSASTTPSPTGTSTTTACTQDTKANTATCSAKIDPATGLPVDWKCTPIGGGLIYCEDPAASGAAPGEGGAGSFDPADYDDDTLDDGDAIQTLGCAGGAGSGLYGILGAIGGLVFMIRARRR